MEGCTYTVTAYNVAGESVESARASVGGEVPGPPASATAAVTNPDNGTVEVSWSAPTSGVRNGYHLYYWQGNDPHRYHLAYADATATSFTTYCNLMEGCAYAVTAYNVAGESAESSHSRVGANKAPAARGASDRQRPQDSAPSRSRPETAASCAGSGG